MSDTLLDDDDFLLQASQINRTINFDTRRWNPKRERTVELTPSDDNSAMFPRGPDKLVEKYSGPKLTKQQTEYCLALPRVVLAAENRGDFADSTDIVTNTFTKSCAADVIEMLRMWRRLQPDIVRECMRVRLVECTGGREIAFKTFNTGSCCGWSWDEVAAVLRTMNVGNIHQASAKQGRSSVQQNFVVLTKSSFRWHFSVSSNKVNRWSVDHYVVDVHDAMAENLTRLDPFDTTLESFPLLYCNGRNAGDSVFLRRLFAKFGSNEIKVRAVTSTLPLNISLPLDEYLRFSGEILLMIPDHVQRLVRSRRINENSSIFTTHFKGTLLCNRATSLGQAVDGPLQEGKALTVMMEVTVNLDPRSKLIVRLSMNEILQP